MQIAIFALIAVRLLTGKKNNGKGKLKMDIEKTCLYCDYYNDGACSCPSIDKWFACPLEEVNPEDLICFDDNDEK